jgi:hypothetical protein
MSKLVNAPTVTDGTTEYLIDRDWDGRYRAFSRKLGGTEKLPFDDPLLQPVRVRRVALTNLYRFSKRNKLQMVEKPKARRVG